MLPHADPGAAAGSVGLAVWLGWLDYVLLAALGRFAAIAAYALWLKRP